MNNHMRLNHLLNRWLFPLLVLLLIARAVTLQLAPGAAENLQWLPWALLWLPLAMVHSSTHHKPALCPSCRTRFPDEPGPSLVERARSWLSFCHLIVDASAWLQRRLRITHSLAVPVTTAVMFIVLSVLLVRFLPAPWGVTAMMIYVLCLLRASDHHFQLRPWCPWCGDHGGGGGGGGHAEEPTPEPDPSHNRDLTGASR